MTAQDDSLDDGDLPVTITASTSGFVDGTTAVTVTDDDGPALTLSVATASISENGGTSVLTVARNSDTTNALLVTLLSSDTSEGTVPATVEIPAGQSSVDFVLNAQDDLLDDGDINVTVSAASAGFNGDSADVTVTDDDLATLSLSTAGSSISEDGDTVVTVSRNSDTTSALTVSLISDDLTEGTVPASIEIPAGESSATFTLTAVEDTLDDGDIGINLTASSAGFVDGTAGVTILDNDDPTLTLSSDISSISETGTSTITVTRNSDTTNALTVNLVSADISEATVPVSVEIPAGDTSATFVLTAQDDDLDDGDIGVDITASVAGFVDGTTNVVVTDDDDAELTLTAASGTVGESGNTTFTIYRNGDTTNDLTVNLTSSNPAEGTVPASVVIAAGQSTATFSISGQDDSADDGDIALSVSASAAGYIGDSENITVLDDDDPTLSLSSAASSISENGGSTTITVTRNSDTTNDLTVTLASDDTSEGTVPVSVTIPAGDESVTFTLTAQDDSANDGSIVVNLTASASGYVAGNTGVTVTDDDGPTLTLTNATSTISENGGTSVITVSRNTDTTNPLTINLTSSDTGEGTVPLSIEIPAGETSATFTLSAVDESLDDGDSVVTITAETAGFTDGTTDVTVSDDDDPTLTLTTTVGSISENGESKTITVTRNSDPTNALLVSLVTSEGTVPATVEIPAGQTSASFTLVSQDDDLVDGDLNVTVTASFAGFVSGSTNVVVADDDVPELTLSSADGSVSENSDTETITVTRNTDTTNALTISLVTDDAGEASVPATIEIPAGEASVTFQLTGVDESLDDGDISVSVTASATGFTDGVTAVTVTDDDVATLSLSSASTTITEGGSETITISHNSDTSAPVTVNLSSDSTAGTVPATVEIPAGQSSVTFSVTASDDFLAGAPQPVVVTASASGFVIASETFSVVDDTDTALATISGSATSVLEGANAEITVSLDQAPATDVTVDLTYSGSAVDGSDFTGVASIVIPGGSSSQTFQISTTDDLGIEGTETITIAIDSVSGGGFEAVGIGSTNTVTIDLDDEDSPQISIDDLTFDETDGTVTLTVNLDRQTPAGITTSVDFETIEGTATEGADYVSASGTLTFPAGSDSQSFAITLTSDSNFEGVETFGVRLSNPSFGTLQDSEATITINDATTGTVSIAAIYDGYEGFFDGRFAVSLDGGLTSATPTVVNFDVGGTATDGVDYTIPATAQIAAGATTGFIDVAIIDDSLLEGTEIVSVTLTGTDNPAISVNPAAAQTYIKIGETEVDFIDNRVGAFYGLFKNGYNFLTASQQALFVGLSADDKVTMVIEDKDDVSVKLVSTLNPESKLFTQPTSLGRDGLAHAFQMDRQTFSSLTDFSIVISNSRNGVTVDVISGEELLENLSRNVIDGSSGEMWIYQILNPLI